MRKERSLPTGITKQQNRVFSMSRVFVFDCSSSRHTNSNNSSNWCLNGVASQMSRLLVHPEMAVLTRTRMWMTATNFLPELTYRLRLNVGGTPLGVQKLITFGGL